jgi:hypothetical protein
MGGEEAAMADVEVSGATRAARYGVAAFLVAGGIGALVTLHEVGRPSPPRPAPAIVAARPTPPAAVVAPQQAPPAAAPIEVTAKALRAAYAANEVAADLQYRGKLLVVTGTVAAVEKDAFDGIVVRLRSGSDFDFVRVNVADAAAAAQLKKGIEVEVVGVGGQCVVGSPAVEGARIVEAREPKPRRDPDAAWKRELRRQGFVEVKQH